MKEKLIKHVSFFANFLIIGATVMIGMRAVEWVIPKPAQKSLIMVCYVQSEGQKDKCEYITDNIKYD